MTRPRNHMSRARLLHAPADGRGLLRPATCEAFQSATVLPCLRTSCGRRYVSSAAAGTGTPGGHAGSIGGMVPAACAGAARARTRSGGTSLAPLAAGALPRVMAPAAARPRIRRCAWPRRRARPPAPGASWPPLREAAWFSAGRAARAFRARPSPASEPPPRRCRGRWTW
eukprot:6205790-Pleurochrysis_carterae.AAC.2